ncbi:MAG: LacI family DNA-binding transcriptional regulator [Pleomorphochaeta sp.]|jgi:LacI family transcriptional regulator
MKTKKTTLSDIAKVTNLSTASVSMILSGKKLDRFSNETINLVKKTAKDLYYTNKKHSSLLGKTILIVCPSVYNPYYSTLIQGMEQKAIELGIRTIIKTTYWDLAIEQDCLKFFARPPVSGIIFSMIPENIEKVKELSKQMPIVAVGDEDNNFDFDTVNINNFEAGKIIGQHLVDLGHKKIAYISTSLNEFHTARTKRLDGIKAVLEENNLPPITILSQDILPSDEIATADIEFNTGYKLANICINQYKGITAIVGINDMVAYGIINAIKDKKLRIPEDYSVCAFDNIFPSKFNSIKLTTIEHSIFRRGVKAMNLMISKLTDQENNDDNLQVTRIDYKSKLINRGTTSKPKA